MYCAFYGFWGGRTCFPGRDCVRLPVHCCIALFCCFLPNQVVRAWPGKSTVFGVAGLVIYFEARKVVQWVLAFLFVLSCIHSLEPTKTGQAKASRPPARGRLAGGAGV